MRSERWAIGRRPGRPCPCRRTRSGSDRGSAPITPLTRRRIEIQADVMDLPPSAAAEASGTEPDEPARRTGTIASNGDARPVPDLTGRPQVALAVEDLTFRYPGGEPVLRGAALHL